MDSAHAAVDQRLDGGVRMGGAAGIVRIVDHAGDAGFDAADRGQVIAGVVILRPVGLGEGEVRRIGIVGKRRRVRVDEAQRRFPGMAVTIHKAGHQNGVAPIDHLGIGGGDIRCDGGDLLAFDQQIAFRQVADPRVHADDGGTLDENAVARIERRLRGEPRRVLCGGRIRQHAAGRRTRRHRDAGLQSAAPGDVLVVGHGVSSSCDFGWAAR